MLYFELRLLGRSAEQDGWPDRNANRSSTIWNGNAFNDYCHSAGEYSGTAHTNYHSGCGTGHDPDSSGDIHTSERTAPNDNTAHNAGNYAANQNNDSEHARCVGSLHHGLNPRSGTEWINRDQQWLESGFSLGIVDGELDDSKFGS